jgi:fructose 5-dehydrogenase small subunit
MNHEEQKPTETVSMAGGPRASRLSRRDLLSASVFTFGGAAIAGTSILRLARAADVAATATPSGPDKFMLASSRLIQHRLSPGVGTRMAEILRRQIPSFDADLDEIIRIADKQHATVVEEFFDALPKGQVQDTAHRIIFGWYAGVVDDSPTAEVLAYEEALMYQPTKDAIALPTYSFNGPDNWTEVDPPLSAMPEF